MNENRIPKQVFSELIRLNDIGFNNWTTGMCELINSYTLDIELPPHAFKIACKNTVLNRFLINWHKELLDIPKHPILRTYSIIKLTLQTSPHLLCVRDSRYRTAISKIRTNSHTLEIEKGRHHGIARDDRLCRRCGVVEDEHHFILDCKINSTQRNILFEKLSRIYDNFELRNDKFDILMMNDDAQILTWFGQFIHRSFELRNEYFGNIEPQIQ